MLLPDNELFNIKFVETVEKYKCLNDTSPQYISKDEQDKIFKIRMYPVSLPFSSFAGDNSNNQTNNNLLI